HRPLPAVHACTPHRHRILAGTITGGFADMTGAVVVTGASTGIGRATALHLAGLGWRVHAGVRRPEDAESLRRESPNLTPLILDVTDPAQLAEAVRSVSAAVGE